MSLQFINMCIEKFLKFFRSLLFLQKEMLCSQRGWEDYIWGRLKRERSVRWGTQSLLNLPVSRHASSLAWSDGATLNEIIQAELSLRL